VPRCRNAQGRSDRESIEPTSINLLRRAGELALYQQMLTFRDSYFQAFERCDREAARLVVDFHEGEGSFDALPPRARFPHTRVG
jgi:hypothetical protein